MLISCFQTLLQTLLLLYYCSNSSSNQIVSTCPTSRGEVAHKAGTQTRWAIIALFKTFTLWVNKRNELILDKLLKPYGSNTNRNINVIMFSELPESKMNATDIMRLSNDIVRYGSSLTVVYTGHLGFDGTSQRYGYKYMCKFFMLDQYHYLQGYDYYLRLDTDCFITKLTYNIFEWAESRRIEYAYATAALESHRDTLATMPAWVKKYVNKCHISPSNLQSDMNILRWHKQNNSDFVMIPLNFYNNFHIGSVAFFTRPDVLHFLREANSSGYVMTHRWGDASVQAYAVRLFGDPNKTAVVPSGFEYIHGSHRFFVANGHSAYVRGIVSNYLSNQNWTAPHLRRTLEITGSIAAPAPGINTKVVPSIAIISPSDRSNGTVSGYRDTVRHAQQSSGSSRSNIIARGDEDELSLSSLFMTVALGGLFGTLIGFSIVTACILLMRYAKKT